MRQSCLALLLVLLPTHAAAEQASAMPIDFSRFTPNLGIGWHGKAAGGRMLIGLDFDALAQGRPDMRLVAGSPAAGTEDEPGAVRLYPVISLTFTYRF
jgi:hypothetical protein